MIKRYEVDCPRCGTEKTVDPDGDWVRYEDHEAELTALHESNRKLHRRCQKAESDLQQNRGYLTGYSQARETVQREIQATDEYRRHERIAQRHGEHNAKLKRELTALREQLATAEKRASAAELIISQDALCLSQSEAEVKRLTALCKDLVGEETLWQNGEYETEMQKLSKRAEAAEAVVSELPERVYRLCKKCSQEYRIPMKWTGNARVGLGCNFVDCPNCGERDDPWVLIKLAAAKQKGGA